VCSVAALGGGKPDFARAVQPILETECQTCHGPKLQMHGLRLDSRTAALKGGESGVPAIVPGNSVQSLLVRYVSETGSGIVMPPGGKRLKPEQIETLRAWIDSGAEWPSGEADARPAMRKGADHWAFQPVSKPAVPSIRDPWIRNPIDAFVLDKLRTRGWKPARTAEPRALLRRVYLDLTGLPPTLEEQERFLRDWPPIEQLVDDLLARPTYAERWARHWLDVVRYAETNGYERDGTKPNAWRFRDYIIKAFNDDKPFDRFIEEQLAGDELPDASAETFVALGYYRLGPWDDEPADPKQDRFDQLDDIVSTTSQAFLGLTLGCARCHNHKFEPLTATDYYSMVAVFDGLRRPVKGRTELDLPIGSSSEVQAMMARDREIDTLEKRSADIRAALKRRWLTSGQSKLPKDAVVALLLEPKDRTETQRMLAKEHTKAMEAEVEAAFNTEDRAQLAACQDRIADLRRTLPDGPRGYYMYEPNPVISPTHLLIRGKWDSPGPEVAPAVPAILVKNEPAFPAPARTSLRRLAFAEWLASPSNPLTARVIVNRVWQHHFGSGLVRTPSDFGVMGERPTHPELLDWLASWFMENGWSIKKLHRLIMSSSTYQMSREWNAEYAAADPENRLLWRNGYQRLEVEALRDSVLTVSGRLNPKMSGPSILPHIPAEALEGSSDPDKIWKESDEAEASRRTIYVFLKRSMIVPMLDVLDLCDTSRSAATRQNTSVATQALTLFNGDFVNRQAKYFAERLRKEAGAEPANQIDRAFRLALARPARAAEMTSMIQFLSGHSLEQMCRVIFNLNEFAYAD
jgi:hypothetical protein